MVAQLSPGETCTPSGFGACYYCPPGEVCLLLYSLFSLSHGRPCSSQDFAFEHTTAAGREDAHDAEADVEQSKRIRDQASHALHPSHADEHPGAAERTPSHSSRGGDVPDRRVHRQRHTKECGEDQREETVAKNARAPGVGQRAGEMAAGARRVAVVVSLGLGHLV